MSVQAEVRRSHTPALPCFPKSAALVSHMEETLGSANAAVRPAALDTPEVGGRHA